MAVLLGVVVAHSAALGDRRNYPYVAPAKPLAHKGFTVSVWTTTYYQAVTGDIIEAGAAVEEPEDTVTDLKDDLGLERELALGIGVLVAHQSPWWPDVRFDYYPVEFVGQHVLSKNLRIGDMSFRAGQLVKSRFEAVMLDSTLLYTPLRLGQKRSPWLILELGATIRHTEAGLNVRGTGIWRVGSERYDVPFLPMGFLALDVFPFRYFGLRTEARAITDGTNQWLDLAADFRSWYMKKSVWIGLGARLQKLDVTQAGEGGLDATILAGQGSLGIRF